MHRVLAVLLLSLISLGLTAPAFSANAIVHLPPCCRAKGKHHCAMNVTSSMQQSDVTIHAVGEKCPCFPQMGTTASGTHVVPLGGSQIFFGSLQSHPAMHAQTEARRRISFSRSRQKRGPPSLLS